jgi:hypothetical protein
MRNLSVADRRLGTMSDRTFDNTADNTTEAGQIFTDPVGYLARYGIEAELVAETTLPAAA